MNGKSEAVVGFIANLLPRYDGEQHEGLRCARCLRYAGCCQQGNDRRLSGGRRSTGAIWLGIQRDLTLQRESGHICGYSPFANREYPMQTTP